MAKKRTTKHQTYPQLYQFGGMNMPFLDQYQKLGNTWSNFWRTGGNAGNYFDVKADPYNYDPQNPTVNDPWGNNELARAVAMNNSASDNYKTNKKAMDDFNSTAKYTDLYTANTPYEKQKPSMSKFQAVISGMDPARNAEKDANNRLYNEATAEYNTYMPLHNSLQSSKRDMGGAFANSASGIFAGVNHMNAYTPEEKINPTQGSKGVMYTAKYGDQIPYRNNGGDMNMTGYTPNTPTMSNSMNEIPGGNIAMQKTPIDLLAIGKGGAHHGFLEILKANSEKPNKHTKVKSTVEIPLEQQQPQQQMPEELMMAQQSQSLDQQQEAMAQYGKYINYNPLYAQFGAYLPYAQTGINISEADLEKEYARMNQQLQIDKTKPRNTSNDPNYMGENDLYTYFKKGDGKFIRKHKKTNKEDNFDQQGIERALQEDNLWTNPATTPNSILGLNLPAGTDNNIRRAVYKGANFTPPSYQQPSMNNSSTPDLRFNRPSLFPTNMFSLPTGDAEGNFAIDPAQGDNTFVAQDLTLGNNMSQASQIPSTNILRGSGNDPYEYKRENGVWKTKRKGTDKWRDASEYSKQIEDKIASGNIYGKNSDSVIPKKSIDSSKGYSSLSRQGNPRRPTPLTNNGFDYLNPTVGTRTPITNNIPTYGSNNPTALSYLENVPQNVIAPYNSNMQGTPINKQSISDLRGETESRMMGLLKMTPEEATNYDASFKKLSPTVKNNPSYLKILDSEKNQLSSKISKLTSEINNLKVGSSTTDWQRKTRKPKEEELQKLQKQLAEVENIYKAKEKQFSTSPNNKGVSRVKWNETDPTLFGKPVNKKLSKALNIMGLYKYGGAVPKFQFGGSVNDQHAVPIFSSNLEDFGLTELQTEKDEVAFMPDGSIVDVKAKELHKNQDKDNVSDIMQSGTYVFSNDPKMKFGVKSKIGGIELGDMKLGKSVFKYVENEITPGPEDIMLKDMFFNSSKKELTTADIAKNIKKNLPIVDMKNDYFADRAIAENKDQRVEYLSILKAFNEFKKPKPRTPKLEAQYGMPIQPTQNGLDGVMGYGDKQMDPFKRMDNNMLSMFNFKQPPLPSIPKMYENGGEIEQAQFGWLADGIDAIGGWSNRARREQEQKNKVLGREAQGYRDQLQQGVDRSGALGVGTNMATYAASLNVPLQKYDDQSEQMAMYNAAANRASQRLEASKYTASQGIGGASSLARYSNPTNYGDYLSKVQSQSDGNIGKINQAMADLDMQRANANVGFVSTRNAGRNQSLNTRDTQLYNANVTGIGNVGKSLQESTYNSADARYRLGNEKMAYDAYLEDKALAAKQAKQQQIRGYANEIGGLGLAYATGGFGGGKLFDKDNVDVDINNLTPATNNYSQLQSSMQNSMNQLLQNRANNVNPIQPIPPILDRSGSNNGSFMNRNANNWNYNFFDPNTWK